jgi:hypothetical protein
MASLGLCDYWQRQKATFPNIRITWKYSLQSGKELSTLGHRHGSCTANLIKRHEVQSINLVLFNLARHGFIKLVRMIPSIKILRR